MPASMKSRGHGPFLHSLVLPVVILGVVNPHPALSLKGEGEKFIALPTRRPRNSWYRQSNWMECRDVLCNAVVLVGQVWR